MGQQDLDLIKEEYLYLAQRPILEDLVKIVVLSPFLSCAGFYHAPFFVKAEEAIAISPTFNQARRSGKSYKY